MARGSERSGAAASGFPAQQPPPLATDESVAILESFPARLSWFDAASGSVESVRSFDAIGSPLRQTEAEDGGRLWFSADGRADGRFAQQLWQFELPGRAASQVSFLPEVGADSSNPWRFVAAGGSHVFQAAVEGESRFVVYDERGVLFADVDGGAPLATFGADALVWQNGLRLLDPEAGLASSVSARPLRLEAVLDHEHGSRAVLSDPADGSVWLSDGTRPGTARFQLPDDERFEFGFASRGHFQFKTGSALGRADVLYETDGTLFGTRQLYRQPGNFLIPVGRGRLGAYVRVLSDGGSTLRRIDSQGRVLDQVAAWPQALIFREQIVALDFVPETGFGRPENRRRLRITGGDVMRENTRRIAEFRAADRLLVEEDEPIRHGGRLFFVAVDDDGREDLWTSGGTADGTYPLWTDDGRSIAPPYELWPVDGNVMFTTSGPQGPEPWITDGTLEGTRALPEVEWYDVASGRRERGTAMPLLENSGGFTFFDQENLELIVKVLDGRSVNGAWWAFVGKMSDLETTVTVTDTETGAVRSYDGGAGQLCGSADVEAFADGVAQ